MTNLNLQLLPLLKLADSIDTEQCVIPAKYTIFLNVFSWQMGKTCHKKKKIKGGPVVLLTLNHEKDRSKLPPSVQIFSSEKKWLWQNMHKGTAH